MATDTHHLVKSILIPQVVSMLMETYSITENEGNSHIKASVGDHKVEKLSDLMVRLIKKYVE